MILSICLLSSCEKTVEEISILGKWESEYLLLEDGTKNFDPPYALLEFEYSDAFELLDDGIGKSYWFNAENGSFDWTFENGILTCKIPGPNNTIASFEFITSQLSERSMDFETPQGHTYHLIR